MEWKKNKIFFEGVSAQDLAMEYGTPLYVYEANRIRENFRRLRNAFASRYPNFQIFYAIKCNSNPYVIKVLKEEGSFCDAASANEIRLAGKMGFQGKEILFSGNNLSEEDFQVGLEHNVLFNLDDISLF